MTNIDYRFIISPEVLIDKFRTKTYFTDFNVVTGVTKICCDSIQTSSTTVFNSGTTKIQLSMRDLISGGTNGVSLLTGLTIPILITQSDNDLGFYTPFDGNIIQEEDFNNFIITSDTTNPYTYKLYNTSDIVNKKFLQLSKWSIDWGNGLVSNLGDFAPNFISNIYPPIPSAYTITVINKSPWGTSYVKKRIETPFTKIIDNNPKGTFKFVPKGGNWVLPILYDYTFSGDSENNIDDQISSKYTNVPFIITGYTKSRLSELSGYGNQKIKLNKKIFANTSGFTVINNIKVPNKILVGEVLEINSDFTRYIINDVTYFDYKDGNTIYILQSSGLTREMISSSAITKDETLLRIVDKPQVWSDVFIERGKNSALENVQRLGEVDNIGDVRKYGYGFFKVKS
jgi:hypothetical protein